MSVAPGVKPRLSVVLVSYNTRELTLRCLGRLLPELTGLSAEVWLVDNASTDGTCEAVRRAHPEVELRVSETNLGFGAANNVAMALAAGEYFLLLNTDAFVEPGSIASLLAFMDGHAEVAAVGPRLLNEDGSRQESIHRLDTPWHAMSQYLGLARLRRGGPAPPPRAGVVSPGVYLKGACLLVRRAAYDRVGGFDERFFFYGDEADWEKRMLDAGWSLAYLDEPRVTHLVGQSGSSHRLRFTLHYYAARDQYMHKHFGAAGLAAYRLGVFLWCVRKLGEQAWCRLRPGRAVNPFALRVHGFLLRHLFRSPRGVRAAIPAEPAPVGLSAASPPSKDRRATAHG